eukprot:m.994423 g.994423  ORF g.994423 m.994423 type:complete len:121 (+) comp24012_c1_seq56:1150-1512(+)
MQIGDMLSLSLGSATQNLQHEIKTPMRMTGITVRLSVLHETFYRQQVQKYWSMTHHMQDYNDGTTPHWQALYEKYNDGNPLQHADSPKMPRSHWEHHWGMSIAAPGSILAMSACPTNGRA